MKIIAPVYAASKVSPQIEVIAGTLMLERAKLERKKGIQAKGTQAKGTSQDRGGKGMKFTATTLPGLRREYNTARRELIEAQAKTGATKTAAAARLGATVYSLNNIIKSEGILWPVKRQGRKS